MQVMVACSSTDQSNMSTNNSAALRRGDAARFLRVMEAAGALHAYRVEFDPIEAFRSIDEAAYMGRLDAVVYLHRRGNATCTTKAMDSAAQRGFVRIVEFLHENRKEGCTPAAIVAVKERMEFYMGVEAFRAPWRYHSHYRDYLAIYRMLANNPSADKEASPDDVVQK